MIPLSFCDVIHEYQDNVAKIGCFACRSVGFLTAPGLLGHDHNYRSSALREALDSALQHCLASPKDFDNNSYLSFKLQLFMPK